MPVECVRCGAVGPSANTACPRCGWALGGHAEPRLGEASLQFDDHHFREADAALEFPPDPVSSSREEASPGNEAYPALPAVRPAPAVLAALPGWLRYALGVLIALLISAAGALAIYLVHRTMPELHPSFQARAPVLIDAAAPNRLSPRTVSAVAQNAVSGSASTPGAPSTTAARRLPASDRM